MAALQAEIGTQKLRRMKKVRLDDVYASSKLRWVDVEHIKELALPKTIV